MSVSVIKVKYICVCGCRDSCVMVEMWEEALHTGSILPSSDFEELLDVCDFSRHSDGYVEYSMERDRLVGCSLVAICTSISSCEAAALALGNFGLWGGISMPGDMIDSGGDSDKLELGFSA